MPKTSFSELDISVLDDRPKVFWFEAAMISTCAPLFNGSNSNYEVEGELRRHKVITRGCDTDTETCALVVNFKSMKTARGFIERLNAYLAKKAAMMRKDGYRV